MLKEQKRSNPINVPQRRRVWDRYPRASGMALFWGAAIGAVCLAMQLFSGLSPYDKMVSGWITFPAGIFTALVLYKFRSKVPAGPLVLGCGSADHAEKEVAQ